MQAPSPFDFRTPDEWPCWKWRFEQFRQASGLTAEDDSRQISTLLYCMGDNSEDTLASTDISCADWSRYATVIAKFDVWKNVIFKRVFNRRNQEEGESAEQFITSLYSLADNCAYGDLKDDLIRDRIVVGICDNALSERLQLDPELTLEKAKKIVRQCEAVQEQQILKNGTSLKEERVVNSLGQTNQHRGKGTSKGPDSISRSLLQQLQAQTVDVLGAGKVLTPVTCTQPKMWRATPASGRATSAQCFSKSVADVSSNETPTDDYYDTAFLNTIGARNTTAWNSTILINGHEVPFKLDTGAEVTVISADVLATLTSPKLHKPSKQLCGPDRKPLDVIGELLVTLSYKDKSCAQPA